MIERHRPVRKFILGALVIIAAGIIFYLQLGDFFDSFFLTCDPKTGECQPISQ
ncbi:MAG: hypothetical protein UY78_C0007G0021 [Parcubacteria group bacterium GW2011_GWA1_53_13]|nr:MAG: hypothetical protein UT56_C0019G0004 [Candidatus Levybacteria bacterium GW2011_GWB1_39_7]KKW07377.1 MAG: hypothetical protein UY42_C0013G0011 [Parcubacteria group bacterium GW2011_GWA2_49_16]KKW33605.1 MAG: hypothetical protein UY78_C0007G0021 [Parcubacteria group bacterium GW2011_GWA1_53_13]